jgi:phosphohistidine phosphatase SixA
MRLIVIRHARAKERDASAWPDDRARPLTKGGRRDFARLAARLPSWIEPPQVVLSSGWVRAWDTAETLCGETGWPDAVREPALETEGGEAAVAGMLGVLRSRQAQASIAIVGHEPSLGELVSHLLGGAMVSLRKGSVTVLDIDPAEGRGTLLAMVPTEALQRP